MLKNVPCNRTLRKCLCLLLLPFVAVNVQSQVANYTFTKSNNPYTSITGTPIAFNPGGLTTTWDNGVSTAQLAIPFTFTFNGTGYTTVSVNSNGYVTFGATASLVNNFTPISAAPAPNY